MTITVDATYENGALKLEHPLPLKEHERVRVMVQSALSLAQQTAGLIGWIGNAESFERISAESEETERLP